MFGDSAPDPSHPHLYNLTYIFNKEHSIKQRTSNPSQINNNSTLSSIITAPYTHNMDSTTRASMDSQKRASQDGNRRPVSPELHQHHSRF